MPTSGLRERKKRETRNALQSAALRLTTERGLDRVTVEAIAEAADVSARTFFNYFSCKEEAIVGADEHWPERVTAFLDERPLDEAPFETLRVVLGATAAALVDSRERYTLRTRVLSQNPSLMPRHLAAFVEFEAALVAAISKRMKSDTNSEGDARFLVACAVAALRVSLDLWTSEDSDDRLPEMLDRALDNLAGGFAAPAAFQPTQRTTKQLRKAQ